MRSIRFCFLFMLGLWVGAGCLQAAEEPWTEQFMREFRQIKKQIENLEKQQAEILEKEDKILEEIARVRIWSRR